MKWNPRYLDAVNSQLVRIYCAIKMRFQQVCGVYDAITYLFLRNSAKTAPQSPSITASIVGDVKSWMCEVVPPCKHGDDSSLNLIRPFGSQR